MPGSRLLCAVVLALAGCVSDTTAPEVEQRLQREITALRAEVSTARAAVAEAAARAEAAEQRAGEAQASLQEVERRVAAHRDAAERLQGRVAALERALARLRAAPRADGNGEGTVSPAPPERRSEPPERRSESERETAERAYAAALARFRAGEHAQAVLDFRDFLARHGAHRLAVNAQYWIGEAYFAAGEWQRALDEFQRVVDHYGETVKSADAWLMIGRSRGFLHDRAGARRAWERVVRDHAGSGAAGHAQRFLRSTPER